MKKQIILGLSLLIGGALQAQEAGSYLHLNVGGGLHNLSYDIPNGTEKGKAGYTLNAAYSYFFSPHWGLQTGIGLQSFSAISTLNTTTSATDVDTDGDAYQYRTYYKNWQEKQQVLFMDIPLELQYRLGIGKRTSILASAGVKVALPINTSYKTEGGEIQTTGYYSKWNVELTDLPEHGFTTINGNYPGVLSLKPAFMGIVDLGGLFKLSEKIDLYAGAYLNYGLNNAVNSDTKVIYHKNGTYNGMFSSNQISNVKPISVGLKVGLYWQICKKKQVASMVEILQPEKHVETQMADKDTIVAQVPKPIVQEIKKDTLPLSPIKKDIIVSHKDSLVILNKIVGATNINFELNSDKPSNVENEKIDSVCKFLISSPNSRLYIIGNTCNIGSHAANLKIGMKRALVVKQKFIEMGAPASQLITESKAYDIPLVPNTTEENRIKNRRVELKLVEK
jgi:outer membrane protein OmpA-like peptidoglycan-associated protein